METPKDRVFTQETPQVLAVIPARGGSKGIPRKNLINLAGKPLIAHSIEHAKNSRLINRIVVSTEDEEIAEVALEYGSEVPFLRPTELAEDEVLDLPVFEHILRELQTKESYQPTVVVHLRPTAPYRKPEWIDEAIQKLIQEPQADSIRSVSEVLQHPYRMFTIDSNRFLSPIMKHEHPVPYLLRRQDLPKTFYYNCVIDVTRPKTILEMESMTGDKILPYVMDKDDVFDIDSPRDIEWFNFIRKGTK